MPEPIYDAAIIGGGIAGAAIARDASLRGLSVVLFEKNRFGSGTSSKSSKLIHGGIRYLDIAWQAALHGRIGEAWKNFRFVFSSLRESRILERTAPGLIQPISLVIPVYRGGRSIWPVYLGAFLYAFLGMLSGSFRAPRVLFSAAAVLEKIPGLKSEGLAGGVMIWDHWTPDRELVERIAKSAEQSGAKMLQQAKVETYSRHSGGHFEIRVTEGGRQSVYRAKKLINASGPWVDQVREAAGEKKAGGGDFIVPVAGSHIMLPQFTPHSMILEAEDARIFFVINIRGQSRVGTTEREHHDPDRVEPSPEEIAYLLRALNTYFPGRQFKDADIVSRDAGIRPLAKPGESTSFHHISREHEVRTGPDGVLHVLGVKLTDHRRAARKIVDLLTSRPGITHRTPL